MTNASLSCGILTMHLHFALHKCCLGFYQFKYSCWDFRLLQRPFHYGADVMISMYCILLLRISDAEGTLTS